MEDNINNKRKHINNGYDFVDTIAGKIKAIQMTNFMCHSNLEVNLNPGVNFITGLNGSGKSTVMAALIVVLGGSATLTGRAQGVSDFIKRGENWAQVSITLVNKGNNAFKKDMYGSQITITRNISKTGSNSYSCKSESGSIVSKKKEEVDSIVFTFNWQIKNPICVLNQDVARSFLCSKDSTIRFSMFMSATQLENLKTIYMKTMNVLLSTREQLIDKEKGLRETEGDLAQLKEKLVIFASLEKHVHGQRSLENEYLWSMVVEEEKRLTRMIAEKTELKAKLSKASNQKSVLEERVNEMEDDIQECLKEIEETRSCEPNKQKKYSLEKKIHELDKDLEKDEIELRQILKKVEKNEMDIKGVEEHLNRYETTSTKNEEENKKLKSVIGNIRESLTGVRAQLEVTAKEIDITQKSKMDIARTVERLRMDVSGLEQKKEKLVNVLSSNKGKGDENLTKYGYYTSELLKSIDESDRRNHFRKKPVGPCGLYVQLSGDPKWARAVESVIGGLMCTYCCDNQKDFQVLARIMDKVCGDKQPPVIISKFQTGKHNVELKKAVVRDHPSIFDVLTFSSDVVHNTFIDQLRIETVILFETDKQAASIMTHIQNVPKNLKMGLTQASDQYYPAPNYRTYYGNTHKPLRFFDKVAKTADSLKKLNMEIVTIHESMKEKNSEIVRAREEYLKRCESLTKLETKLKQLKQSERKFQVELKHLQDKVDSIPVTITKIALEEELSCLQKNYAKEMEKAEKYREKIKLVGSARSEYLATLNQLLADDNAREELYKQITEGLEQKKSKRDRAIGEKGKVESMMLSLETKLKEMLDKLEKSRAEVERKTKQAEEVCPERIDTQKTPLEVQKMLEKCERYLKTAQKVTGSKEEVIQSYKAKRDSYKEKKKMVDILKASMEILVQATCKKLERLKILQTHTANLATLKTRGYDGQLIVDFERKTLELEVTPVNGNVARKDTKTLSGGERSYSTVSFILAIWKVVDMPVYFLDEFDVFMDSVNRKVIMNLLLEHASVQTNKQFIFITPHDVSGVHSSDQIAVYRLPDPKRKVQD
ncbi:hypothetical protein RUM43_011572 [Polyplax serrata]|uniref:RecF/RecN/SMC N-terminal domain-containing protein n=1 Tax=Polyplax serrata TaxID=468196 RepID=A0AAN8NTZ1_POLSC